MNKKLVVLLSALILVVLALNLSSCNKKPGCTDENAENFDDQAEVDDESCISPRKKYVGQYNSNEQCIPSQAQNFFTDVREANDNLTDIQIYNMANIFSNPVRATISQSTFIIEKQDPDGSGLYISGNGSIAGNSISIQYRVAGGFPSIDKSCIVTMNK